MGKQQDRLQSLCRLLTFAKFRLEKEKREFAELEAQIAELLPAPAGTEGATTSAIDGFKITVNRRMNRTLDHEAYLALNLSPEDGFVEYKPSIKLSDLRRVEKYHPEFVNSCVTIKPAKTAVKVEAIG